MDNDTLEMVTKAIATTMGIPADTLRPDTSLAEIHMDSLEALQLLIELEEVTHIQIEEEDLKQFKTVQSIVNLVNERFQKAAAA